MFEEYYNILTTVEESIFQMVGPILVYAQFIGAIGALIVTVKVYSKLQKAGTYGRSK